MPDTHSPAERIPCVGNIQNMQIRRDRDGGQWWSAAGGRGRWLGNSPHTATRLLSGVTEMSRNETVAAVGVALCKCTQKHRIAR